MPGRPDVGFANEGELNIGRQYANDSVWRGIQRDYLTDDIVVASEVITPHGIADHHHRRAFRTAFFLGKLAPKLRLDSERGEKVGRHTRHRDLQRLAASGQI
jgi:hypothetical protein